MSASKASIFKLNTETEFFWLKQDKYSVERKTTTTKTTKEELPSSLVPALIITFK